MASQPASTVVIPVLNGAWCIADQLTALAGQDFDRPFEVLVCDNGSTDDTVELAKAWEDRLPGLRVVDASDRIGASHARNVGIREAQAAAIAFCDADDVVSPEWLRTILASVRPGVMVNGWQDYSLLNPTDTYEGDGLQRELIMRCAYLPGIESSNFAMDAADARLIKGYDESFLFAEDVDIAWRGQQQGFEVMIVPAVVHIRLRPDALRVFRQHRNWAYWSIMLRCRHQHLTPPSMSFKFSVVELVRQSIALPWVWLRGDSLGRREAARQYGTALGELCGHLRFRVFGRPPVPDFSVLAEAAQ